VRIPPIADEQDGLFTRVQAESAGIARSTVARNLKSGRLLEVQPGVVSLPETADSIRRRIRAAAMAIDAPATHWSAALLWHLDHDHAALNDALKDPVFTPLEVTTSRQHHPAIPGLIVHRIPLPQQHIVMVDGIATTSRVRTCIDLIAALPRQQSRSLAFRAHQQGWLSSSHVRQAIGERRRMDGTPRLREVEPFFASSAHSNAEWLLVPILNSVEGIRWRGNVRVTTSRGAVYVLDAVVVGTRLAIEVDGYRFHADRQRFADDRRRQNDLVLEGWTILRFTWHDLENRPEHVAREIAGMVAQLRLAS